MRTTTPIGKLVQIQILGDVAAERRDRFDLERIARPVGVDADASSRAFAIRRRARRRSGGSTTRAFAYSTKRSVSRYSPRAESRGASRARSRR